MGLCTWSDTPLTDEQLEQYWAAWPSSNHSTRDDERRVWEGRTKAECLAERGAAWRCNDRERFTLATAYFCRLPVDFELAARGAQA